MSDKFVEIIIQIALGGGMDVMTASLPETLCAATIENNARSVHDISIVRDWLRPPRRTSLPVAFITHLAVYIVHM